MTKDIHVSEKDDGNLELNHHCRVYDFCLGSDNLLPSRYTGNIEKKFSGFSESRHDGSVVASRPGRRVDRILLNEMYRILSNLASSSHAEEYAVPDQRISRKM